MRLYLLGVSTTKVKILFHVPLFDQDMDSYKYLVESIRKFPTQQKFSEMISDAGFSLVRYENLNFGVAAIHSGYKM